MSYIFQKQEIYQLLIEVNIEIKVDDVREKNVYSLTINNIAYKLVPNARN